MTSDVQFVVDAAGEKTAVILSLSEYESIMEDLDDLKIALERKDEEVISLDDMKREFVENE